VDKVKAGVVGVGYLGQFHAEKYAKMEGVDLVGVVDIDASRAKAVAKRCRTQPFSRHTELLHRVQAVSIAVPTPLHHAIAKDFLLQGIDVLLEKPISKTLEEADELINLAESKSLILQIGHLERFSGPLLALEGVVQNPMFIESNRLGPFLMRGTDVDVVLDLMIHDIDIILSWIPSKVKWFHAVGIPVLTSHIDIANVRVEFENGCTANLTASRVSREKMRKIRLFQPTGYLSIDFLSQKAIMAGKKNEGGKRGLPGIFVKKFPVKKVDPLKMEIESFVQCVQTRATPRVTGRDGRRALELALQIVQMIQDLVARRVTDGPQQG
jgi:predicted dehydrogenase